MMEIVIILNMKWVIGQLLIYNRYVQKNYKNKKQIRRKKILKKLAVKRLLNRIKHNFQKTNGFIYFL